VYIEVVDTRESSAKDFETFAVACYLRLVARLRLVVRDGDEAQDLAQEAMLRAWQAWPELRRDEAQRWAHVVGLRLALNELRRRRRMLRRLLRTARDTAIDVGITDPDLWSALEGLSRGERAALVLHVIEGYTYGEIAQGLGVAPGTVASWISRGKAHLRAVLEGEDDERTLRRRSSSAIEPAGEEPG
jgi:RNA polymerase sigma-70 factor (ECF subfamily)